ncbi:VanW family protein [Ornithinibacillus halophilus]|uniref:Vancomycin resistance protein YoaR, contains peptidoglycan-binding and VanW domains n=1 Tax=Ornithinibacillus halophilus TaxID=930117 RepID=A0A1M5MME3_9BACI|nr:VanW family protein [Ornithinibacillus halophilus]SHG78089.1 Vancomycin resistance protein YoaR, contains peptidoglycan-binding and VanW domains [Ornithinibacillus halophilus]
MWKRVSIIICLIIINPLFISAQQLVITDGDISETILRDHFALYQIDDHLIDVNKLSLLLKRLDEQTFKPPTNAMISDNESIISGKSGVRLDKEKFLEQFMQFFYSDQSYQIKLPKKTVHPQVDSELIDEIRSKEIGRYITYYRTRNKERSHNIALSAEAINNYVVLPGKRFSFNEVVGKRTKEKGYMRAPVIVKGELSEDIGGGICQVSSTLFNAVLFNGIEIVERYSHSKEVPYVPPGKDATVSWWGPDFVFTNELSHPILIRAKAENGMVEIRIFTSDRVQLKE